MLRLGREYVAFTGLCVAREPDAIAQPIRYSLNVVSHNGTEPT